MTYLFPDRRNCLRSSTRHERVAWSTGRGTPPRSGWVVNLSREGIAFAASAKYAPTHGGAVRLTTRASSRPRFARVVRVCDWGNGMVRLGCRWITKHPRSIRRCSRPLGYPKHDLVIRNFQDTGDLNAL